MNRPVLAKPMVILALSVVIVSTAAIMIRLAQQAGVPSLSIAFWRLGFAVIVLSTVVSFQPALRMEMRQLSRRTWLMLIGAGFFLALHFASWISSLAFTSVASSAALVTTNPVWIAIFSWLLFREKIGGWLALGIITAMLGSLCIFVSDSGSTSAAASDPLLGNTLALIGSLTVCGYLLIGRRLAQVVSIWLYVTIVFAVAALFLLVFALVSHTPLMGFSTIGWLCLIGLALGPQLLGHSGINWSLKFLTPALVAVAILAEPIGSALLAWLIFDERFAPLQLVGFALLLIGIFLATQAKSDG